MEADADTGNQTPQLQWRKIECTGEAPSRRSGHTLTIVGSNGFLFGGCDYAEPPGPTNDLFQLRIHTNGSCDWSRVAFRKGPLPRWKHSATLVDNKIYLFGGFHNATTRFQDVWIFNPITMEWSQPVPQSTPRSSTTQVNKSALTWPGCPAPRGGHSASLINREIYIFGGYGGQGYSRRDFDDLYALNVDTMAWGKVSTKGKGPERRSGHQACAVDAQLFVFGGWNCTTQFNDLHIFDTETLCWSSVEGSHMSHTSPRWNHASCAVLAIPNAKIFCFGGVLGQMNEYGAPGMFTNDISVLDTGTFAWTVPETHGTPPAARADTTLAYDDKGSRLMICGGWANLWFNDVFSLDVSCVVGPPYAITGVRPSFGAITGGLLLTVEGIDFTPKPVIVRFSCRKGTIDVPGTYVNDQTLTVTTPDFSMFPPGDVQIRVALQGDSFTTTFQMFNFFAVTSAAKTLAYGAGVQSGGAAAEPITFLLQACDANSHHRVRGGDEFMVSVRSLVDDKELQTVIQDMDNGTYAVTYTAPTRGEYEINVQFCGTFGGEVGTVYGFPLVVSFDDAMARDMNRMTGKLVMDGLSTDLLALTQLIEDCGKGLDLDVGLSATLADETAALIQLKEHLFTVEKKGDYTRWLLEKTKSLLAFLSTAVDVEKEKNQLANLETSWNDLVVKVPVVAARIAPRLSAQSSRTKADIQGYHEKLVAYATKVKHKGFWEFETGMKNALHMLDEAAQEFSKEEAAFKRMRHVAEIFECLPLMDPSEKVVQHVSRTLERLRTVWTVVGDISRKLQMARDLLWVDLDGSVLEDEAKAMMNAVKSAGKEKEIKDSNVYQGLEAMAHDFLVSCPLYQALRHPSVQSRHWVELMELVHQTFPNPIDHVELKFADIMGLGLHRFQKDVEDLTERAQKESRVEQALQEVEARWTAICFDMSTYKDTEIPILRVRDEDVEILEADQVMLQSMLSSRVQFFKGLSEMWSQRLTCIADVTMALGEFQRTWSYLEPLFIGSDEVKKELPDDAAQFVAIDAAVKEILTSFAQAKVILTACTARLSQLQELATLSTSLQKCQNSLIEFLDGKRRLFPRFYFTSEADLLDILSNGGTPAAITKHLSKVFLATQAFTFESGTTVTHFVSNVGNETIRFVAPVTLSGKVEGYLTDALNGMKLTLKENIKSTIKRYPQLSRTDWLMSRTNDGALLDAAQVVLLVSSMEYVKSVEAALVGVGSGHASALSELLEKITMQLNDLIKLTRGPLNDEERQRVMCMITTDAHSRDVVQSLISQHVTALSSFVWQAQLKPRLCVTDQTALDICDATFEYGLEYLGNGPRLVITPLTDRMYVTATQALNLHLGCAPSGPAGTGKTETTKDLASALGKPCYVFNCSPEMDFKSLGNIFKGLASSGAWGCFDEFNRLIPEVLSVCCLQFKAVCDGIKGDLSSIILEGDSVVLDPTCGTFITMNPGYLGRSELPEGLKALFRPITVMLPDLCLICENMLMAQGFTEAKTLASKFYHLYHLCKELLSQQDHYDWGLRAIKSILLITGSLKRSEPTLTESQLLLRALRDFNVPKLVLHDQPIFHGLLHDLFPEQPPPRKVHATFEKHIESACETLGLWPEETFRLKVVQLDELLVLRHCVFVMGPAGAGKSECILALQTANGLHGTKVKLVDINPKVVSTDELYGSMHVTTREWKDGLLSKVMRDLANDESDQCKWLVLDGDLDANWIESMNSVMDDNKTLTLASNERIPLKNHMRLIFEIQDLAYATPATVSRAGILYLSTDEGTQYRSFLASWLSDTSPEVDVRSRLGECVMRYVEPCLAYHKKLKTIVPLEDISVVQSFLHFLDATLTTAIVDDPKKIDIVCGFASIWAFGAALCVADDGTDYRKLFSEWWRAEFKGIKIPIRDTVFEYYLNPTTFQFDSWRASPFFTAIKFDGHESMHAVTVPTTETVSTLLWTSKMISEAHGVMLCGHAGTGKTQMIKGFLTTAAQQHLLNGQGKTYLSSTLNFNYYTNAAVLQSACESKLVKRMGSTFGPMVNGAQWIFFLDDLNLPMVDPYRTQSALALLRQLMDYNHWYDRAKFTVKQVVDCQFVTCMNPTGGSFYINPRLQRHFATFAVTLPSATSLLSIYQTFLDGHLNDFNDDIRKAAVNILKGALALHAQVSSTFRKTAANFHYEFNIRHLSNVVQGILMSKPAYVEDSAKFVLLWLHESARVYGDRLVSRQDLNKYNALAQQNAKKLFPSVPIQKYFAQENADALVFCPQSMSGTALDLDYDQVLSVADMKTRLEEALADYNLVNPKMDLVLFKDAIEHVARIMRIISIASGHAMLVGVGGSGRKSLARLSAYLVHYAVVDITITQSYTLTDFKTDLQSMFARAGMKGEKVAFVLSDADIKNERMLVYINDLLSSGSIADLYTTEEQDAILAQLSVKVKGDKDECWAYFLHQLKEHVHCILCFSPAGSTFRVWARKFPALVNCTIIDWFQPWPVDALQSVAVKCLATTTLHGDTLTAVEQFMPHSFESVNGMAEKFKNEEGRVVYTTPKTYLEFLSLYTTLLVSKQQEMSKAIFRLQSGLDKLESTSHVVANIEEDLTKTLEEAMKKKAIAEEMADVVAADKLIVERETEKANVEADKCAVIHADMATKKADTERELAAAQPMVDAAMAALDTLNRKDLGNCKTMSKPPAGVGDIFASVMLLFAGINPDVPVQKNGKVKEKDRAWEVCKKILLANVNGLIDELKNFKLLVDTNAVPEANWKEIRPLLELPHFNVEIIEKRNSAAAGLCAWVINIVQYYDVLVTIEPKRKALQEITDKYSVANEKLTAVQTKVHELEERLAKLTASYEQTMEDVNVAIATVERGKIRMNLAKRLTAALGSENIRWQQNVDLLKHEAATTVGDVLIAAAFVSYAGPFTKPYRELLVNGHWRPFLLGLKKPLALQIDATPVAMLTPPTDEAAWIGFGLPSDRVSIENGTIVQHCKRWPLLIDPQLQAIHWLRAKEALVVVRQHQPSLILTLETAIEHGQALLLENIEEKIDPLLWPVISRCTMNKGRKTCLKLGDKVIEWAPSFRLYLHTTMANPHYAPEIQAETTLVNFSVTPQGLEDQLLALVVRKEWPKKAKARTALIQQQNRFKITMQALEDKILTSLAEADGDVTENVTLIGDLETTKATADALFIQAKNAADIELTINQLSARYQSVARRGALLFFILNNLHKLHAYHVFSLNAFVVMFQRGMDVAKPYDDEKKSNNLALSRFKAAAKRVIVSQRFHWNVDVLLMDRVLEEAHFDMAAILDSAQEEVPDESIIAPRCASLQTSITEVVFDYVRRGLFEKDKLVVATQLCFAILKDENKITAQEITFLTTSPVADDMTTCTTQIGVLNEWLPDLLWSKLRRLEELVPLLTNEFKLDGDEWREWYQSDTPESDPMPGKARSPLVQLLLLRTLRPDRLLVALSAFIASHLGSFFIHQPPFDLESIYQEASASTPIFFILFPGVDPTADIEQLGRRFQMTADRGNFVLISMGQGQEGPAERTLERFAADGSWVVLQNIHLMPRWLPHLTRILDQCSHTADPNFRCFLSAEAPGLPTLTNIPEMLLQVCIKVANEAPADLKSNLRRAWASFSLKTIETSLKPSEYQGCLFALCFYHAVILGRKRFGCQGWSRPYSFNQGDLTLCADVLRRYMDRTLDETLPWDDLRYIFGEIMYGGHITDFWDRLTNKTYLQVLFKEDMLKSKDLMPGLAAPDPYVFTYSKYASFIETSLPVETPAIFGLHPNTEIQTMTSACNDLFLNLQRVGSAMLGIAPSSSYQIATTSHTKSAIVQSLTSQLPSDFDLVTLQAQAQPMLEQGHSTAPYVVVAMQECTRMNSLLQIMRQSLNDLIKGMNGQLNMTDSMEELLEAMSLQQVPGRNPVHSCSWERYAWASRKPLSVWFADLLERASFLSAWVQDWSLPTSMWLSGLFNPAAFLTAVKQVTARNLDFPLDNMTIETHILHTMVVPTTAADKGFFVHGLYLEGARWYFSDDTDELHAHSYTIDQLEHPCAGHLSDAVPKEVVCQMPIVYIRAVSIQADWEATATGYFRHDSAVYECPVYVTSQRGPTFVFLATLSTKAAKSKWIIAGVALLLQKEG
ncbi:hypothetical protein H310_02174 [Aphanomyces invadans]|uniref:IPT/TIG domain-containing protein n=1 Tax=Aphanomyces invadans TaxID=157072 RepID=A0A024UPF2_9STRA|nr:hypothetical protein H310_02174 [Aphanomyces invadans]ETW07727.1 hypothetical protein H310_02174 [Aphanomyces invadans]|eukprot:XP_008863820.1 hypothetical protein H310_02174 [Aphanomyces invadans]